MMQPSAFHAGAIVVAAYICAGLAPERWGSWRAVALAILPAATAWWVVGRDVHLVGLAAALVCVVSACGYSAQTRTEAGGLWIVFQVATLLSLVALLAWVSPDSLSIPAGFVVLACAAGGVVVAVEWGGAFVGRAIKPFTDKLNEVPPNTFRAVPDAGLPKGFADGGKTIGRWERLLIFLFVLAGAPAAIGFLVTAKSILRFGEIKDRESHREAEYIIIGTLMSFGFALVASALTRLVLSTVAPDLLKALSLGAS